MSLASLLQTPKNQTNSVPFKFDIDDIDAGAKKVYGFDDDAEIRRYLPVDFLRILNKSSQPLAIFINQNKNAEEIILDDVIFLHDGNFFSFTLENVGTETATGAAIYTTVQKKAV